MFVKVTAEKLVGGPFWGPPSWIGLKEVIAQKLFVVVEIQFEGKEELQNILGSLEINHLQPESCI